MSKPANDLSGLFRSLAPTAAGTQAAPAAVAQAAEQRWPLLKAIAPRSPAPPPALSQEDKARWTTPEPVTRAEKRTALSMPGLRDKLTKSLGKMGGRLPAPLTSPAPAVVYVAPVGALQGLAVLAPVDAPVRRSLLTKPLQEPVAQPMVHAPVTDADDSLSNIFGRLAKVDEEVVPVAPRKSSFLSRIGKK